MTTSPGKTVRRWIALAAAGALITLAGCGIEDPSASDAGRSSSHPTERQSS